MKITKIDVRSTILELQSLAGLMSRFFRFNTSTGRTPGYSCVVRASHDLAMAQQVLMDTSEQVARLKERVVRHDKLGDRFDSIGELIVRAIRLGMEVEVGRLMSSAQTRSRIARSDPENARWIPLAWDAIEYMLGQLIHADNTWFPHRNPHHTTPRSVGNRQLYRQGIHSAYKVMRVVGYHPECGEFLRDGAGRQQWRDVKRTCSRLLALTAIDIWPDPDLPVEVASPPWRGRMVFGVEHRQ
jgi:hypothetical protein